MHRIILATLIAFGGSAAAEEPRPAFSQEQLEVAEFWKQMGPTLRDDGIEAYAKRYHADFRHWSIGANSRRISNKESAVKYWSKFHEDGHHITCTHVEPLTINFYGDKAFARLVYEQTDTYADGRVSTNAFNMASVFQRVGDTWQVLESNMALIKQPEVQNGASEPQAYKFTCPDG